MKAPRFLLTGAKIGCFSREIMKNLCEESKPSFHFFKNKVYYYIGLVVISQKKKCYERISHFMDSHSIAYTVAIVVFLIFLSYFRAAETAFEELSRSKVKNAAAANNARAQRVLNLLQIYDRAQLAITFGSNLLKVMIAVFATILCVDLLGARGIAVAVLVTVIVVWLLAELTPKRIATEFPEDTAYACVAGLRFFTALFIPFTWLAQLWRRLISRIFKFTDKEQVIEEELITIVEEAETEGAIGNEQSELIQNAIEFNDLQAWDVLTPRIDLVAIDKDTPVDEITEMFRKTGFSRIPVYEDEIDNILGILNQKDFHNYIKGSGKPISDYVKPVVFVAGSIKIAVLLKKMQTAKTHIAVVIDEYGGTEGIVTMEDIIEELVGEIYDEHDAVTSQDILLLRDGSYRILGSANLEKFFDFFDVEEDVHEVDVTTVNGWAMVALDNLPQVGDMFERVVGNKRFQCRITVADDRRAKEINVRVEQLSEDEE